MGMLHWSNPCMRSCPSFLHSPRFPPPFSLLPAVFVVAILGGAVIGFTSLVLSSSPHRQSSCLSSLSLVLLHTKSAQSWLEFGQCGVEAQCVGCDPFMSPPPSCDGAVKCLRHPSWPFHTHHARIQLSSVVNAQQHGSGCHTLQFQHEVVRKRTCRCISCTCIPVPQRTCTCRQATEYATVVGKRGPHYMCTHLPRIRMHQMRPLRSQTFKHIAYGTSCCEGNCIPKIPTALFYGTFKHVVAIHTVCTGT